MCSDVLCVLFGIKTSSLSCPDCGKDTSGPFDANERRALLEESGASISGHESSEAEQELPEVEVVYLTEDADGQSGRTKILRNLVRVLFLAGIPIMCVSLAVDGQFRVPFSIGALLSLQFLYLRFRVRRFTGPLIDDEDVKARISPPLKELCAAAKRTVPQVQVKRTPYPAAMGRVGGRPTLWVSPDFLRVADDSEVRAVISHEVSHLRHDIPTAKKGNKWIAPLVFLGWLALFIESGDSHGIWIYVALGLAFLLPGGTIIAFFAGFSRRKRETRADLEGAAAINDPEAMIRGIRAVYSLAPDMRRRIYGPKAFRWIFFPYSLPPQIHPPLEKRVADLRAISMSEVPAKAQALNLQLASAKVFGGIVRLVAVLALVILFILWQHQTSTPSISPNVESPGGAHFIPLEDLGLSSSIYGFRPLSGNQLGKSLITAKKAESVAASSEGVRPGHGVSVTVAEGSLLDGGQGFTSASGNSNWSPAYIVIFSGPNLFKEGFPIESEDVVMIDASHGTVTNDFIMEMVP
jgi:Zn-dependent protease with chaperone function